VILTHLRTQHTQYQQYIFKIIGGSLFGSTKEHQKRIKNESNSVKFRRIKFNFQQAN